MQLLLNIGLLSLSSIFPIGQLVAHQPQPVQLSSTLSSFENFQIEIAHIGESLFSDNYAKFKTKSFNLPDQFKEFVELFKKAATPAINKSTKLKLIGNKEGRPRLPYFARINKEGDAVITNNFLGDKVSI